MGNTRIKIGDWTVTPTLNLLETNGHSIRIEPRAVEVLAYLASHAGEAVSAEQLITAVWQGRVVGEDSVYRIIKQLRRALDDDSQNPRYIRRSPSGAIESLHRSNTYLSNVPPPASRSCQDSSHDVGTR